MKIGLDSNILVQLALETHARHLATRALVEAEWEMENELVFPSLVVTEFLHVVTDPKRFANAPFSMVEALEWIEAFVSNSGIRILEPTEYTLALTLSWMKQHQLGRKRVLDTHLASIYKSHGITRVITSNPKDFGIFGAFELCVP